MVRHLHVRQKDDTYARALHKVENKCGAQTSIEEDFPIPALGVRFKILRDRKSSYKLADEHSNH
jgi:hypothetical protein